MNKTIEMEHSHLVEALYTQCARYKVLYGGRGGSKSWEISSYLIQKSIEVSAKFLCIREKQNKIEDSVYSLLDDTTKRLGVGHLFGKTKSNIIRRGSKKNPESKFIFSGLRNIDASSVKSFEGAEYCWCEEAQDLSDHSIKVLFPTIRKPKYKEFKAREDYLRFLHYNPKLNYPEYTNDKQLIVSIPSEIILSFNPENEDDAVYERFIVNTPKSCILININYTNNPCCPPDIIMEANECKERDIDEYNHVYKGQVTSAGRKIYAKKYNKDIHIRTETREQMMAYLKDNSLGNYMAIDPHSKYYPFCIWVAVVRNEHAELEKIIYNECPTKDYMGDWYAEVRKTKPLDLTLLQLAQLIYSFDGNEYGVTVNKRFADTRYTKGAGSTNVMTNSVGMIETWKRPENGSMLINTPPEKMIDIQRMNIITDLDYNRNVSVSTFNKPRLTICPWCFNTQKMFELHRENKEGTAEDEKYKDASDTLRILYAGLTEETFKTHEASAPRQRQSSGWMGA